MNYSCNCLGCFQLVNQNYQMIEFKNLLHVITWCTDNLKVKTLSCVLSLTLLWFILYDNAKCTLAYRILQILQNSTQEISSHITFAFIVRNCSRCTDLARSKMLVILPKNWFTKQEVVSARCFFLIPGLPWQFISLCPPGGLKDVTEALSDFTLLLIRVKCLSVSCKSFVGLKLISGRNG